MSKYVSSHLLAPGWLVGWRGRVGTWGSPLESFSFSMGFHDRPDPDLQGAFAARNLPRFFHFSSGVQDRPE
jgi:hypothetical protein